jgi:diguanylate cyclase (GGDEF)-like protein
MPRRHSNIGERAMRVLIVDDDEDFRGSLDELLQLRGYDVITAANPDEALAALAEFAPPVVMIDVRLGHQSGVALLSQIVSDRADTICIMITAYADKETAVAAMRQGAYDFYEKTSGVAELNAVLDRAFEKHQLLLVRRRAEQQEAQISHMAHHDHLTDLPNRMRFRDRLEHALTGGRRESQIAVLCLDLDHFKNVNDTLGHPVGDELLKAVAVRLRSCVRGSDTIARLGGDEFAIIQMLIGHPGEAARLASRIQEEFKEPFKLDGHQIIADVSIGISIAPGDASEPDQLLKNADLALYGAKSEGRGTYKFFEPEMDARMRARRRVEIDLRNAIANGEFEMWYQPLINLSSNKITGLEALLRWRHPGRGLIAPTEFISIAEETGLIVPLGEWALRKACSDATIWPDDIGVAVNLSPAQFKRQNLVQVVANVLATSGLPANRLELEITEAVLMENTEATRQTLHELKDLGLRIVMDDFGIGYCSLSYLRSFPFDKIKIDRSFIGDLSGAQSAAAIVLAIATLARSLNMTTTAEGIESQQQLEIVRAADCTEAQGYFFSAAKPANEIIQLLVPRIQSAANAA